MHEVANSFFIHIKVTAVTVEYNTNIRRRKDSLSASLSSNISNEGFGVFWFFFCYRNCFYVMDNTEVKIAVILPAEQSNVVLAPLQI